MCTESPTETEPSNDDADCPTTVVYCEKTPDADEADLPTVTIPKDVTIEPIDVVADEPPRAIVAYWLAPTSPAALATEPPLKVIVILEPTDTDTVPMEDAAD